MAGSMQQLQVKIREAKQELYGLDSAMKKVSKGNNTMNQLLGGVAGKFGMSASMFTGVGAAVAGVGAAYKAISDNISTAMGFEKSMSQLSSLTGMVGKDLEQLKEYAIELGSTSTLTASQVADAFRLIGSQQPQLLSSGEALKEVTKYAITLSEAAGIDLVTAAQTLSTSINQMGGDSDNAARYVNVLAAASQKGAGDIAWLGEAITKSATAAKAVGTDYEELVANLEQLAKGGFDASTAGTALRSIIMNLEKQANQEFKPSIVGLTQAFENLGKANLDIVGYQEMAGKMFASQAKVLADAAGEARNMTTAITGTNTATQQASTNTANLEGSLKSLASAWEGLNLHINSSNGYLKTAVDWLKDVVVWADKAIAGLGEVKGNRDKLNGEGNGGQTKVDRMVGNLENTSIDRRQSVYTQQVSAYWKYINEWDKKLKEAESRKDVFAWETIKKNNDISEAKANIAGAQSMLKEYQSKAQKLLKTSSSSPSPGKGGSNNGIVVDVDVDTEEGTKSIKELQNEIKKLKKLRDDAASAGDTKLRDQYNAQIKSVQAEIKSMRGTGSTSTNHKVKTETVYAEGSIAAQAKLVSDLTKKWNEAGEDMRTGYLYQLIEAENKLKSMKDEQKALRDMTTWGDLKGAPVTGLGESSFSGKSLKDLQGVKLELKLPKEKSEASLTKEIGSMAGGISQMVGSMEALGIELPEGMKDVVNGVTSLISIVSGIATIVTAIEALTAADTIIPFAHGGVVHAANGFVQGNNYSGDMIPAALNAGELVLNKAQQGNLASQLQGAGMGGMQVIGEISGEKIVLVANRFFKRTGQGEIVTW
jgi:TP901 family phage tail tape measure protein